jgi:hypothetical protein
MREVCAAGSDTCKCAKRKASRLEYQRDSATRGRFPLGLLDIAIFGRPSIVAAAGWVAINSRSAENQCSSARPSSRPLSFQIS